MGDFTISGDLHDIKIKNPIEMDCTLYENYQSEIAVQMLSKTKT